MSAPDVIRFQHVIDPEDCARCGSCEAECGLGAISHDERNYVVDPDKCEACLRCLAVCGTGSIDAWLPVQRGSEFSVIDQLAWDALPQAPLQAADTSVRNTLSADAAVAVAQQLAPPSAAVPQVNLFSAHAPAQAVVAQTRRLTAGNDIRHIVLDFGDVSFPVLEGQTIGILAPGSDASGRRHAMRAYSVASARDGEEEGTRTLALTVKRIVEDYDGKPTNGVCSNYLCDLAVGERVEVVGPYGQSFLAPNAPGTKILMICTGTGIAPMRGIIERRCRHPVGGDEELVLFYGARTPADMPYYEDLTALAQHRSLDFKPAFSRAVGRPRQYVQDLLIRHSDRVAELLRDEQCFIYLCGVRGMDDGVLRAFAEIAGMDGIDWPEFEAGLRDRRRLHIETY